MGHINRSSNSRHGSGSFDQLPDDSKFYDDALGTLRGYCRKLANQVHTLERELKAVSGSYRKADRKTRKLEGQIKGLIEERDSLQDKIIELEQGRIELEQGRDEQQRV